MYITDKPTRLNKIRHTKYETAEETLTYILMILLENKILSHTEKENENLTESRHTPTYLDCVEPPGLSRNYIF